MPQQPSLEADLATLENEILAREGWGPLNAYAGLTRACHRKACREGAGCARGLTCWAAQPKLALIFILYHWAYLDMSFGEVVALGQDRALGVERARETDAGQGSVRSRDILPGKGVVPAPRQGRRPWQGARPQPHQPRAARPLTFP